MLRPAFCTGRDDMAAPSVGKEKQPVAPPFYDTAWFCLAVIVLLALVVYHKVLWPGSILLTSDDNIGALAMRKALLPQGFLRAWDDSVLAGQPMFLNLTWTNLLLWALPVRLFQNAIHAVDLVVASLGMALFLRERGVRGAACVLGALTACWLGSTFFLTYAGHIGKFGVVMFACLALWLIERAARRRSWAWAVLAGGAMGAMFLEQADVALFFAMVLGAYAVYAPLRERQWNPQALLPTTLPILLVTAMVGFRAVWMATAFFSLDLPDTRPEKDHEEVWDYCTQWSWPPEETIEWLAPGFYGWGSGNPAGPYVGRLGRHKDWDKTPRGGYPNLKLETLYLGAIPLSLAAFALVLAFGPLRERRADAIFWLCAAAVTFLLGLGKFNPLYRLFFELPGMSSIRAPVKFMQVTQLAVGVLAAWGLDGLLRVAGGPRERWLNSSIKLFSWCVLGLGGAFLLTAMAIAAAETQMIQRIAANWGDMVAPLILQNQLWALAQGGFLLLVAGGFVLLLLQPASRATIALYGWLAVCVVAIDQLSVSRHYVQTVQSEGYIERNAVIDYLQQQMGAQRAYLVSQDRFYNQWLSVLFPYHGIPTYNVAQIRMPQDYEDFLKAVGGNIRALWQYFAVGDLVGPAGIWPELQNSPPFKGRFELAYAFNVAPRGAGVSVMPATASRPGQQVIIRHVAPAPRFGLLAGWEGASPEETLLRLRDPARVPFERALVPTNVAAALPPSSETGLTGSVDAQARGAGYFKLKVATDRTAILRVSEKYSRFWRARVNGQPAEPFRCDYVFLGLVVPPGLQTVELEHQPPLHSLYIELAGLLGCLGAGVFLGLARGPVPGPS